MHDDPVDQMLAERAGRRPDAAFLRTPACELSYRAAHDRVQHLARGFAGLGVGPGQYVPVVMANSADFVMVWFALVRLGAVPTLVNTVFRGPALARALAAAASSLAVVDAPFADAVAEVRAEVPGLGRLVVRGPGAGLTQRDLPLDAVGGDGGAAPASPPRRPGDPALVLFTSGTTGPSKGCVLSHRYVARQAALMVEHLALTPDDVLYCPFPLFHLDASVLTVVPALTLGTTAAVADRFSVSGFWDDVRRTGATVFDFMGATLTLLHQQPSRPDDAANPARLAWGVPMPAFAADFEARFGLRLVELYGSTDVGVPIYQPLDEPRRPGSCGRAIAAYEVELFGGDDRPVDPGAVGEIVVRPREPHLISEGYLGAPEASLTARRNLWFHTGDLARRDADGWYSFAGRATDSIRRRGENLSAFEIEEVVKMHPDVADAAAFGVPSPLTEDEVMVAVVARDGHTVDPAALVAFCGLRLARAMVPRYVEVVDSLPRTPTEKVATAALRERGVTPATFDADGAG